MAGQVIYLPLRLESTANKREHWAKRHKRNKAHRNAAILIPVHAVRLPATVTITRVAPRMLDSDNLAISAKGLRDGIADRLGVNDADPRITWAYSQRKGEPKEYAVEVRIE